MQEWTIKPLENGSRMIADTTSPPVTLSTLNNGITHRMYANSAQNMYSVV